MKMPRAKSLLLQHRTIAATDTDYVKTAPLNRYIDAGYKRYCEGCRYSGEAIKTKGQWLTEEIESTHDHLPE